MTGAISINVGSVEPQEGHPSVNWNYALLRQPWSTWAHSSTGIRKASFWPKSSMLTVSNVVGAVDGKTASPVHASLSLKEMDSNSVSTGWRIFISPIKHRPWAWSTTSHWLIQRSAGPRNSKSRNCDVRTVARHPGCQVVLVSNVSQSLLLCRWRRRATLASYTTGSVNWAVQSRNYWIVCTKV